MTVVKMTDTDKLVGTMVRERRTALHMSAQTLADRLDVSYQQVCKYERGFNRISAGTLFQIATILDVPVSFFFKDGGPKLSAQELAVIDALRVMEPEELDMLAGFLMAAADALRA